MKWNSNWNEIEDEIIIPLETKGYKYTSSNIHKAYAKPNPGSTL